MRHRLLAVIAVPALLAGILLAPGARPAEAASKARFLARADAFVDASRPDLRTGGRKTLQVDDAPVQRTLLRFAVSDLRGPVVRATLRLFAIDGSRAGYRVFGTTDSDWEESGVRWKDRPGRSTHVGRSGRFGAGRWTSVDVTPVVSGNGTFSFVVTTPSAQRIRFASRQTAKDPRLVITTQPETGPVIAAAGDIACDPDSASFNGGLGALGRCRMLATSDILVANRSRLTAILALGDTQYDKGTFDGYQRSYAGSWGRVLDITLPVPGNHEYRTPGAAGYFAYFGSRAGDPDEGWYATSIGSWRIIVLNSECWAVGGCAADSPQGMWLANELATNQPACTIAAWHTPRSSSSIHGDPGATAELWSMLHQAGVDVILNGHAHNYERFVPLDASGAPNEATGMRLFIAGTGGVGVHGFPGVAPGSAYRLRASYGVLELTLRDAAYDWRFVPQFGQRVRDPGSAPCHGTP